MTTAVVHLTEENQEKLTELSRRTGKTQDELLNEAVEHLPDDAQLRAPPSDWKSAVQQAAGMWKDRDDIPQLMAQLRQELNREPPSGDPK